MKVELNSKGMLTVSAESGLEAYALGHWAREYFSGSPEADMLVIHGYPNNNNNKGEDDDVDIKGETDRVL